MSREYKLYLDDILAASAAIIENIAGLTFAEFAADANRVKAVVLDIVIIGEACNHIPQDIRDRAPELAWDDIVRMRNLIVHGYWRINERTIWETASNDVLRLHSQIEALLNDLDEPG